jgi:hypothetical protein
MDCSPFAGPAIKPPNPNSVHKHKKIVIILKMNISPQIITYPENAWITLNETPNSTYCKDKIRNSYHARSNQILDSLLDLLHVHPASQVQVLVQQIAVPILFGRPGASPDAPRGGASARLVPAPVQCVQHGLVRGQSLLGNHIPHQAHHVVVRQARRSLSELPHLVQKILRGRIRQEILRLPALLHGLQVRQQFLRGPAFQRLEQLQFLRCNRMHSQSMLLRWRLARVRFPAINHPRKHSQRKLITQNPTSPKKLKNLPKVSSYLHQENSPHSPHLHKFRWKRSSHHDFQAPRFHRSPDRAQFHVHLLPFQPRRRRAQRAPCAGPRARNRHRRHCHENSPSSKKTCGTKPQDQSQQSSLLAQTATQIQTAWQAEPTKCTDKFF